MRQTYEALLHPDGHLRFLDALYFSPKTAQRVWVTFTQETVPVDTALCGAALSEPALAQDWQHDEEDAAWAHLQLDR